MISILLKHLFKKTKHSLAVPKSSDLVAKLMAKDPFFLLHIPVRGKLSGTRFWLRHPFFLPIFHHGTRFGTRFFSLGTRILFSKSP